MKWPPTICWTAPKTINGNRHFQVKAYGGKNEERWVDIFPPKIKKILKGFHGRNSNQNGLLDG